MFRDLVYWYAFAPLESNRKTAPKPKEKDVFRIISQMLREFSGLKFVACCFQVQSKSVKFRRTFHGILPELREIPDTFWKWVNLKFPDDRFCENWLDKGVGRLVPWKMSPPPAPRVVHARQKQPRWPRRRASPTRSGGAEDSWRKPLSGWKFQTARSWSVCRGWMDGIRYQYQKTDRNGRLQVSREKLAKSKKACETHGW